MLGSEGSAYIEPVVVQDIYVTELAEFEHLGGGTFRVIFVAHNHGELIVVSKLIATREVIRRAVIKAAKAIGLTLCEWCILGKGSRH